MEQHSSHRWTAAVAAGVFTLTLGGAVLAPGLVGASAHTHRALSEGVVVKVGTSKKYGNILMNASGRTLYFLSSEKATALRCKGGCLSLWRPLMTKAKALAGTGIAPNELGTAKRGRSLQVTYYGHPLYLYAGDKAAGQVNGEGIPAYSGWWYVLTNAGTARKAPLPPFKQPMPPASGGGAGGTGAGGGW